MRRVSGEDIRVEMGARWPHRVLYESPKAIPMMEPMPVLRDALLYCCTQHQPQVWRTSSNHLRTAEHDVNVAPDTVAVLEERERAPPFGASPEQVTNTVPSHPHPIRSCRSKPIMPVSMRAPDGWG